ncbi:MAG: hypothetical protein ACM3ZC_07975 [Bacteroidota bacterium]
MPEREYSLTAREKAVLRALARRVADIAADSYQTERRSMWYRHNRLQRVKPMVLVFPEGAWRELLPEQALVVTDPFWRKIEWYLRHLVYRWHHLRDDNVIEAVVRVPLQHSWTGWGFEVRHRVSNDALGSWGFEPSLKEPGEAALMRFPRVLVDEAATRRHLAVVQEVLGDILRVERDGNVLGAGRLSLTRELAQLRGLETLMLDMCDRPEWVHQVMDFMCRGVEAVRDWAEEQGYLFLNNGNHYVGSGGVGYTDELPAPGFAGRVRLQDLWGFAESQELALVSPAMLAEFVLPYQARLLAPYGLVCYGCCEPMTHKFTVIKQHLPRLRRVSISPWTDLRVAAEALQDGYIFSWKPNPALMIGDYDPAAIRRGIREALAITKDCVVEIVLKDTHTVEHHPERLSEWVRIAQEMTAG